MPPVREFCGKNYVTRLVIEQCDASGFATWIELEPERCNFRLLNVRFEHNGERKPFEHSCLARGEQDACSARVYWVQRLPVGIDHKNE